MDRVRFFPPDGLKRVEDRFLRIAARMQRDGSRPSRKLTASLAVALALFFLVFIAQASIHTHPDGQDDPTCGLCQVAHVGVGLVVALALLRLVLQVFGEIFTPFCLSFTDAFFVQSPSRAPPTLTA
jgi:hypothetical protein